MAFKSFSKEQTLFLCLNENKSFRLSAQNLDIAFKRSTSFIQNFIKYEYKLHKNRYEQAAF